MQIFAVIILLGDRRNAPATMVKRSMKGKKTKDPEYDAKQLKLKEDKKEEAFSSICFRFMTSLLTSM